VIFFPLTIPALFIKISTGPKFSSAILAEFLISSKLETSHLTPTQSPPS